MQHLNTPLLPSLSGALFAIVALAVVTGCGNPLDADYSELQLVTVSGTVTLDSRPLAGARVIFESEDQTYSYGITNESGAYTLMFNSEQEGVTSGKKNVRITMGGVLEESDEGDESGSEESSAQSEVTIPEIYNSSSTLTETVKSGSQTFDFDLKSAP